MSFLVIHPVMLVGAGPGDPDLLTIKAAKAIASADVILIDDLVNPAVLEHASSGARVQWVGKRGGCQSTPQAFIEKLMVREALAGHRVVRLKGGDPLVFGRAGEEIQAMREAGIEVQIINGITSALAAGSALGISLTHRDHSPGLVMVTGHPHDSVAPSAQAQGWVALAQCGYTLAIYMGVARAALIQSALIEAGLSGATPAAVVQHASGANQRHVLTSLGGLLEDLRKSGLGSPALLIVGQVVGEAQVALAREQVGLHFAHESTMEIQARA
jgi:uroporphyrin-III C-methyltransferase